MSDDLETQLIIQAKSGDRQAFNELVLKYHQPIVEMLYRFCGDLHLADDAAQEAFIRAWERLPKYEHRKTFRSWVYRIAANQVLDQLRREKPSVELDETGLASRDNPEKEFAQKELSQHINQAVLSLPLASRSVLILREYEGFSYREIAEMLEIPLGTVMSRLNYGRKVLMKKLSVYLEEK